MEKYWEKADHSWTDDSIRIFNTPSTRAKQLFYYIQEIGHFKAMKPYFTERQNLKSYLLKFTFGGKGRLRYQGQVYTIEKDDIFFINCMNYQHYATVSDEPWEMDWIHFYGPNVEAFYEEYIKNGSNVFKAKNDRIHKIIKEIMDLQQTRNAKTEFQISLLIHEMLNEILMQKYDLGFEGKNIPDYILKIKNYLEDNFKKKISLQDLEHMCSLNKFQLSKEFTHFIGIPPIEYLINFRINIAKSLLRYTNKSVKEIAYEVGIEDTPYFNRLFKRKTEMTPLEYRKNG
ncbi:AraC family transcriptional regulator [Caldifermentibacillus hisashii]|uniref:AraC family transcriptional regulator n=1 Tax=Caldifermentibacillus hisashii TaxID=996558 RepID=UPI001C1182F0|nr:AraC family transcriptional regulator [Caldifermentibacillus hisashii]MBU5341770.1 AraC family transcriptional regulator [Caldifermentibacillus hisashii]